MDLRKSLSGALAGTLAAGVWLAQQAADKRVFECDYDDAEILGKLVTRGDSWPVAGTAMHLGNGALFGAAYAQLRPFVPGPLATRALALALVEHVALWPLGRLVDSHHPARRELTPLSGNARAFAQATWRHALFGIVLGEVERRLNPADADEPPPEVPVSSNGHGNIETAVGVA